MDDHDSTILRRGVPAGGHPTTVQCATCGEAAGEIPSGLTVVPAHYAGAQRRILTCPNGHQATIHVR